MVLTGITVDIDNMLLIKSRLQPVDRVPDLVGLFSI